MGVNVPPTGPVLYAEDDDNDVFLLQRAFQKANLPDLKVVHDGQQAVDYLSASERDPVKCPVPSLVLLDINMPFLSGLEVLAWMRKQPAVADLPVLVFTSSSQEKDIELAYRLNATAYITKPSAANILVEFAHALRAFQESKAGVAFDFSGVPGYRPPPLHARERDCFPL